MQLQLVNFEQAKALKGTGFDWSVDEYFKQYVGSEIIHEDFIEGGEKYCCNSLDNEVMLFYSRPTVALALKWLREVKGLHCFIGMDREDDKIVWYMVTQMNIAAPNSVVITTHIKHVTDGDVYFSPIQYFDTHDLAESAGLDKGLGII